MNNKQNRASKAQNPIDDDREPGVFDPTDNELVTSPRFSVIPAKAGIHTKQTWIPDQVGNDAGAWG